MSTDCEIDISGIGMFSGIYKIAMSTENGDFQFSIDLDPKLIKWSKDTFGYVPHLKEGNDDGYILVFKESSDAIMFKIIHGHLWQIDNGF